MMLWAIYRKSNDVPVTEPLWTRVAAWERFQSLFSLHGYDQIPVADDIRWAPTQTKWHDEIGHAHAYLPNGKGGVCGYKGYSGQLALTPEETGQHACARCRQIAGPKKIKWGQRLDYYEARPITAPAE